jgi:hypothetical protein
VAGGRDTRYRCEVEMTERRAGIGSRSLSLTRREVCLANHDRALVTNLNGYIIGPKRIFNRRSIISLSTIVPGRVI